MYITNSLLSTADRTQDFWIKLATITPQGMQLDDRFAVDLSKLPTGPARGHDMLIN
jgi:selenium-binding protein 1